jgi:hypothetical protein
MAASEAELTAPWEVAFSTCPLLHIDEVEKFLAENENFIEKSLSSFIQ